MRSRGAEVEVEIVRFVMSGSRMEKLTAAMGLGRGELLALRWIRP